MVTEDVPNIHHKHEKKKNIMNSTHQNIANNIKTERQVLIDKFYVPKEAKSEFVNRMMLNRHFIKNLPGFITDNVYEHTDEEGNFIYVTVAIWQNSAALDKAKEAVQQEYKRINFAPPEMLNRLHIKMEREIYSELDD
ncbi:antibiotic biosynthesis monooxygenase family protein [Prolixibacter denitrificans]|uniref:antibiotic biosynthesis monooxygenase family protein n=1 Tax=Prolixibacter denitrificans TaxID=1541063 RepID=UPI001B808E4F|nr:antibiotic biosynthesis monooxygenase [Prolixibacter denitrificans]